MLEQPNFADWLSKYLKNKLLSQKLSLKFQPVSCRRHCRHRKKTTLLVTLLDSIEAVLGRVLTVRVLVTLVSWCISC